MHLKAWQSASSVSDPRHIPHKCYEVTPVVVKRRRVDVNNQFHLDTFLDILEFRTSKLDSNPLRDFA